MCVTGGFDLGLAFDGDADRVFVVDETGPRPERIDDDRAARRRPCCAPNPGATILHNLICSRAVPEVVREHGGVPVRTKVGHSFIKQMMADTGAVFGGEHSAHYYFARNYRADSGLIASLMVIAELGRSASAAVGACASRSSATRRAARSTPRSTTPTAVIDAISERVRRRTRRTASTG